MKKISKILGIAVTLAMLISMIVVPTSAGAGTLAWGAERGLSTTAFNMIDDSREIVCMAQSGDTIIVGTTNGTSSLADNKTYKSTDGGWSWSELTVKGNFKLIAIAPDDADTFVALDNNDALWYTTTGGARYDSLSLSGITTVYDIDISPGAVKSVIAVGANSTGGATMKKYSFALFSPTWTEEANTSDGFITGQDSIFAARFSPNYATDKTIVVVSANQGDAAYLQVFWDESDKWNNSITGFTDYTATNLDVSITGENVLTADIALPSSYMGLDEDERIAYIALATNGPGGGVYRYSDAYVVHFKLWNGNEEGPIYSIAYHDSGKLIAGDYNESQVYQCLSPTASPTAKMSKVNTLKQPGGSNMVTVGWYGDTAVACTRGDETAFAESTDDGYSWNDISMIDTDWDLVNNFSVNADGSKYYVSTTDTTDGTGAYDTSIWVKTGGKWYRVYTALNFTTDADAKYIVRAAPDDDTAVYILSVGTQNIWVSKDSGMSSWKLVSCYKLTTVTDIAVESADVVYAAGAGALSGVSKTSNAGGTWGPAKKPTEGLAAHQIIVAPNGDVIVGQTNGYLAYSQDGGSTFTRSAAVNSAAGGNCVVTCDDGYTDNNLVYVGNGDDVYRMDITSPAPATDLFDADTITNEVIYGIVQVENLTYVTTCNGSQSYLYMTRKLETASTEAKAEWSSIASNTSTGPGGTVAEKYNQTPNVLRASVSSGTPKLWTVDTGSPAVESYTDPTSLSGPTLSLPADDYEVKVNPGSGRSYDVTFTFDRYSSDYVTAATLQVATDPDFNAIVATDTITNIATDTIARLIGPYGTATTGAALEFLPGTTYYWRVRTTSPMFSEWSETRTLSIESPDTFTVSGPVVGAADVSTMPTFTWAEYEGAIKYEIAVSEDPTFAILEWSANVDNPFYAVGADNALKYSTTYYWRVRGVTAEPYLEGRTWITPAGPWVTGVFTTMAEPVEEEEAEPVVITEPGETRVEVIKVPVTTSPVIPTYLLWVIVGVGAGLLIALIVLIVRTRRVA
jgi:hypothetical protein